MSGIIGGIGGALGTVGFVKSLVTQATQQSQRFIVWPIDPNSAAGSTGQDTNTSSTGANNNSLTGYIPVIEEHRDELTITEHPVEQGAAITDHAFKMPSLLTLRIGWSTSMPANNPLSLGNITGVSGLNNLGIAIPSFAGFWSTASDSAINAVYAQLLDLQLRRILLQVSTARRLYSNMLLQSLSCQTDEKTEHSILITAVLKELILVSAQQVQVPVNATANANPGALSPSAPQGSQPPKATGYNPSDIDDTKIP